MEKGSLVYTTNAENGHGYESGLNREGIINTQASLIWFLFYNQLGSYIFLFYKRVYL